MWKGGLVVVGYILGVTVVYAAISWGASWPIYFFWNKVAVAKWGVFAPITFGWAWVIASIAAVVTMITIIVAIALWEGKKREEVVEPH